jgi:hypothetical protein
MEQGNSVERGLQGQFGKRLLQDVVDERARSDYSRPYAYVANSRTSPDGFIEVSYGLLANAVNRMSRWLEKDVLNICGNDGVFAYLGPSDWRYVVLILATMKTKGKVRVPFHKPAGHL